MAKLSAYFSKRYANLEPYVPGEQPQDKQYIKLNTNESPYEPAASVLDAVKKEAHLLNLYSDPECTLLRNKMADVYGLKPGQILMTNGSDEALNFAFMAFSDEDTPLVFPDITYGFYPVFAQLNKIPYYEIPLAEDFSIDITDYMNCGKTIVIANPNAPTGLVLSLAGIEKLVQNNQDAAVIIDEAYVDFGNDSARSLINIYDNLLVIGTFSKSKSLAGARLGFAFGNESLIAALNTIKYSTNPYNVNRLTMVAGLAALESLDYYDTACQNIIKSRDWTSAQLRNLGFEVLPSCANFVFAKSKNISGEALYNALKQRGILVRHFNNKRITDFNRITIGTQEQMELCISAIKEIMKGA